MSHRCVDKVHRPCQVSHSQLAIRCWFFRGCAWIIAFIFAAVEKQTTADNDDGD